MGKMVIPWVGEIMRFQKEKEVQECRRRKITGKYGGCQMGIELAFARKERLPRI
jgi:hypothetical protein